MDLEEPESTEELREEALTAEEAERSDRREVRRDADRRYLRLAKAQVSLSIVSFVFSAVAIFASTWYLPSLIRVLSDLTDVLDKLVR